jgi:eukaryotic-like serine/threonine-protein kinase
MTQWLEFNQTVHTPCAPMDPATPQSTSSPAFRRLGRYELRRLLGKSAATMCWLVADAANGREFTLTMPREQPSDEQALEGWIAGMRKAAKLDHPQLAVVSDIGVQENWPFVAVERSLGVTLAESLAANPARSPSEWVDLLIPALQGLAYLHDAGAAHLDVQAFSLIINEQGRVRWIGVGAAGRSGPVADGDPAAKSTSKAPMSALQAQRDDAERDVLACGVVMHRLLSGEYAFDEADVGLAIRRLAPFGQDILRLAWTTPYPIPDALRAIVNRSTAHQERQRYHNARTLVRALEGWRQAQALESGGPLALLLDRLHSVGHLPAMPGLAGRVASMTSLEGRHADEMAEHVLQDMALSLELLRLANSAQMRTSTLAGSGPVLAIRRSIALLGVDGVRRAANTLRLWPGPLQPEGARAMQDLIDQVRLAGFAAQALRPPGYDAEVVYLIVVLQNLGRLLVQYHFPDDAEQIQQLTQPAPPPPESEPGTPDLPGMSDEAAACAVLGVDVDTLRAAVVRHWGLGDEVLQMSRRLVVAKAVRTPDDDAEVLRATASAGNELADAIRLKPAQRAAAAVAEVASRYARVLKVTGRDVRDALQGARAALREGRAVAANTWVADAPEPAGEGGAEVAPDSAADERGVPLSTP